jgi:hypothetical protein
MPYRFLSLIALICLSASLYAQSETHSRYQIYGGYSFLSNSLNGVPGSHQGLNGFDASFAIPAWHNLRFKVDFAAYNGTNLGAPQHPYYIVGGGQYDIHVRRETLFVDAMAGDAGANHTWSATPGYAGQSASFVSLVGGGIDTPLTRRLAFRISGGYQYSYFKLQNPSNLVPYELPGLPTNFGRLSSGLVWKF